MIGYLINILEGIVEAPDAVSITEEVTPAGVTVFRVTTTNESDMGKLLGKGRRMKEALSTCLYAKAMATGKGKVKVYICKSLANAEPMQIKNGIKKGKKKTVQYLREIVDGIVEKPDAVNITEEVTSDGVTIFRVTTTNASDMGRLIGKNGHVKWAMGACLYAKAMMAGEGKSKVYIEDIHPISKNLTSNNI